MQREVGWRVVEHRMPAPLRFEQQGKGGIAADVDAVDGVHLAGDSQGMSRGAPVMLARGGD